MARIDKLTRLVSVFDQFNGVIASLDDPVAKRLAENWRVIRGNYVDRLAASRSALATGMEQGLRETPAVLGAMQPETRKVAAEALATAVAAHYPEFLIKDSARLEKIDARGSIRGENEFYLVRHHIDVLESDPSKNVELLRWYALVERFESRRM